MKIQVTATHPTTRVGGAALALADIAFWRIKWNGPGTQGAYMPGPNLSPNETITDTGQLSGADGDHYTVAIEWFDQFGQKSIAVLPTVTLHVPNNLPAAPSPGDGSTQVLP